MESAVGGRAGDQPGGVTAGPPSSPPGARVSSPCPCRSQTPDATSPRHADGAAPRRLLISAAGASVRARSLKFHVYLKPDFQMLSSALKSDVFSPQIPEPHVEPQGGLRGRLRPGWWLTLPRAHRRGVRASGPPRVPAVPRVGGSEGSGASRAQACPWRWGGPAEQLPPGQAPLHGYSPVSALWGLGCPHVPCSRGRGCAHGDTHWTALLICTPGWAVGAQEMRGPGPRVARNCLTPPQLVGLS